MSTRTNLGPKGIDWNEIPLGELADNAIANLLGIANCSVAEARNKRGIAPVPRSPRILDKERDAKRRDARRRWAEAHPGWRNKYKGKKRLSDRQYRVRYRTRLRRNQRRWYKANRDRVLATVGAWV